MFESRRALEELLPDLLEHALLALSAEDALRFLGKNPTYRFRGDATIDLNEGGETGVGCPMRRTARCSAPPA